MRLFQDSHGLERSSVAAPGPGSHTLPQLLGRQCLHPIACFLLRPFSDGYSGMPYNFPDHVFILNISYVVIKLSVISLVFQEFYMATIFIDDKVKLMIFWTQSQCLSNTVGLCSPSGCHVLACQGLMVFNMRHMSTLPVTTLLSPAGICQNVRPLFHPRAL